MPKSKISPLDRPEGLIPFRDNSSLDFERGAQMTLSRTPRSTQYDRSLRQYVAELVYCGARGFGYGKDAASAQWQAIRKCYAAYRQRVYRDNTLLALRPALKAAEKRLKDGLRAFDVSLQQFVITWHRNDEFYSHGYRQPLRIRRSAWMIQISIRYHISLDKKSFKTGDRLFMAEPGKILASLNQVIDEILNQDFAAIRYVSKHESRLIEMSKQRREKWFRLPLIQASQAKPGDVLIEQYRRCYFQVVSVSPTGSKVMINEFWSLSGPQPVKRLLKAETEKGYVRMSYDEFCALFARSERLARISAHVKELKEQTTK